MRLDGMQTQELPGGLELAIAKSHLERGKGLMWMDPLPVRRAIKILKCSSVHTFWMRFTLDLIWLDADDAVLRVDRSVPPRRVKWCKGAKSVVECNAGEGEAFAAALQGVSAGAGRSASSGGGEAGSSAGG
jgi:uncharacterized membrane protein (UPF0127 family)